MDEQVGRRNETVFGADVGVIYRQLTNDEARTEDQRNDAQRADETRSEPVIFLSQAYRTCG